MPTTLPFHEAVRVRRAVRAFASTPLSEQLVQDIFEDAQWAPSNCNTQPWAVHVVSGAKRDAMSEALLKAHDENQFSPDFSFDTNHFHGAYADRSRAQGASYYQALGIAQEDYDECRVAGRANLQFFGAPHVAFLFMPSFGDNVRVASDIGMYGQTLLLALAARGLGGIPQTMLGFFAGTVRAQLGLSKKMRLLFGVSFGYIDKTAPGNSFRIGREAIRENVSFHS
jgi:nitroreductase